MAMSGHNSGNPKNQRLSLLRDADRQLETFKRFVETSGQALGMADLDGRIFFVNATLLHLLGEQKREDVYRHHLFIYYNQETAKRIQDEILPLVHRQGHWVGELNLISKQGHAVPIIENIFLLLDYTGKPLCFATVITDISQRVRMEEELRAYQDHLERLVSERTAELEKSNALLQQQIAERKQAEIERLRLAAVLENTSDLVATARPDGRLTYINEAGRHMLGWDADEDIQTLNLRDAHRETDLQIIENEGIPTAVRCGLWRGESVALCRDGQTLPTSQVIMAHRGENGEVAYLSTIMRDMTEQKQAERALRTSEAKYRLLHDSMRDGFVRVDLDGRIREFNDIYADMLGYPPEELKALTYHDITPEKWHAFEADIHKKQIFPRGYSEIYEKEYISKDGTVFPVELRVVLLKDDEDKPSGMWATVRDISERKKIEEALKESEARYRQLFENAPVGIYRIDYKTGRFLEINDVMREYLGYGQEELAHLSPYDVLTEKSKKLFMKRLQKMSRGEEVPEIVEYEIIDKKGKQWVIQLHTRNIYDAEGHVIAADVVAHDITERKRIEQALQENLALLAEAEHMGLIGSWRTDMELNPVRLSSGLRRIWGFPETCNVTSEELASRIHPDDRDQMLRNWRAAIEQRRAFTCEYRIVRPDGKVRHIDANSEIIFDTQKNPVGIHGVLQDVTDRKRLEDEVIKAQKLESIGTLAGGLAHDYNNLLAIITGNIELVKMKIPQTDQAYAPLTKAEAAAARAHDLTQQLITFSRGGYPRYKIMSIRDLLLQSVTLALSGSGTTTEWKISDDLPEVNIDENQTRQVIHNIVINAREAMPQGGTLCIEADKACIGPGNSSIPAEGTYARLIFRDEGHGISAENITKVFDPFFTTKNMGITKGMGLGLSICYSIMKRHGGYILVESKEGIGTTVTLYIPAVLTDMAA